MLLPIITVAIYAVTFVAEKAMLWKRRTKSENNLDKSSLAVFDISGVMSIPLGIVLAFTEVGRMRAGAVPFALAGILLMLGGTALRWTAIATLSEYFTVRVTIFEEHKVIRRGVYKYLRHPSYTGLLLRYLGFGLGLANWLSAALVFLPLVGAVFYRIHVEETALRLALGTDYLDYSRTTKRLIPKIY